MGIAQALGQTVVLQRKFDPEDWLRLVEKYKVTSTFSAPTPIRMVCNLPDEVKAKYDVSSMKRMIANAAPWSFALEADVPRRLPGRLAVRGVRLAPSSASTAILRPEDQLRKPGSCGKPAPMVEIKLFDDDGNEVTGTGPEHTGELFVKSPSVFADYYKQHDKFLADQQHGYQTVGDIAYRDDEGYIYICDRKKDMIISGGMNIYPGRDRGRARAPSRRPRGRGVRHPERGVGRDACTRSSSFARARSMTEDDVMAFAREHLASYKIPRSVTWIDELPKTGSGKILKRELRAPFWAGRDQQGLDRLAARRSSTLDESLLSRRSHDSWRESSPTVPPAARYAATAAMLSSSVSTHIP